MIITIRVSPRPTLLDLFVLHAHAHAPTPVVVLNVSDDPSRYRQTTLETTPFVRETERTGRDLIKILQNWSFNFFLNWEKYIYGTCGKEYQGGSTNIEGRL